MRVVAVEENVKIDDLSHDGRGIARINGKVVFVDGALPNEVVNIQYIRQKKDFDEAKATAILQASAYRQTPPCPHFGTCGGCSLQHLSSEGQIHYKNLHWLQLMEKMGGGRPDDVLKPLQESLWHYRRKARLGVKHVAKKDKTLIGFREKHHPQYLIDMENCWILEKKVDDQMPKLRQLLNALPSQAHIAQIELAVSDDVVALVFRHLQPLNEQDQALLKAFAIETGFHIYLQAKGPDSLLLFYPEHASFSLKFHLPAANANITFEPLDFIQVNQSMNEAMIEQALKLLELKDSDVVLDLFCGLGNFTLPLARRVQKVYGVEGSAVMIDRAKANAMVQGFTNIAFSVANLMQPLELAPLKEIPFNKILLDPPRDGALAVIEELGDFPIERMVYVSCHPATLARDAAILRKRFGFRMLTGGIMDMFPHTSHIESIALFVKE
jgi:23S rRNA (uracil1939-C5)-methyltransferase